MLKLIEDYGPIGAVAPNGGNNVRTNDASYAAHGVRSNYAASDMERTYMKRKVGKTPKELFFGFDKQKPKQIAKGTRDGIVF